MTDSENIDLREILEHEKIIVFFQPVISLRHKSTIMFEALSRGYVNDEKNLIPPHILFDTARREGMCLELDRICRKKALKKFKEYEYIFKNCLISINIDTSILCSDIVGSGHLFNVVKNLGIPPSRVVIEIVESSLDDIVPLEKFVRRYKEYGFLIAIDDLGAGFSNLSRTINIQPNIIELDMNLVRGVSKDFHKRETTKAVIQLAHTTGALTVGEGVENMEDAVCLLNSGVDMLQGYLFAKPSSPQHFNRNATDLTIKKLIEKFKTERIEDYKNKKKEVKIYNGISNSFIEKLSHYGGDKFDGILNVLINKFKEIECAYIIDKNGIQISDTISKADSTNNTLFRPDSKGVDQSSKDYFFYIRAGQNFFVSDPYISVATGNICTTISSRFSDLRGNNYVLCIDMINRRQ